VRLIGVIKPHNRQVIIYAPDLENPVVVKGDAALNAGDIVPGFELSLSKLFEAI